jgi:D-sedoheptulose 7-phosphate isomerase
VGRFAFDRGALPALALSTDSSALTAIGNDYLCEQLFARQVRAHGRPGDVFIGFTMPGHHRTILRAFENARAGGLVSVGFAAPSAPRSIPAATCSCRHLLRRRR